MNINRRTLYEMPPSPTAQEKSNQLRRFIPEEVMSDGELLNLSNIWSSSPSSPNRAGLDSSLIQFFFLALKDPLPLKGKSNEFLSVIYEHMSSIIELLEKGITLDELSQLPETTLGLFMTQEVSIYLSPLVTKYPILMIHDLIAVSCHSKEWNKQNILESTWFLHRLQALNEEAIPHIWNSSFEERKETLSGPSSIRLLLLLIEEEHSLNKQSIESIVSLSMNIETSEENTRYLISTLTEDLSCLELPIRQALYSVNNLIEPFFFKQLENARQKKLSSDPDSTLRTEKSHLRLSWYCLRNLGKIDNSDFQIHWNDLCFNDSFSPNDHLEKIKAIRNSPMISLRV